MFCEQVTTAFNVKCTCGFLCIKAMLSLCLALQSCFQFVLESSVWNVNPALHNYWEWMHVPWDDSPWAIFVAVLCRILESFSSNAKCLLFTCKLKMSLLELGYQCMHIMLISIIMVFGHSVRISFLRGTFYHAKLKIEDWICSSFILSVSKHSLSAYSALCCSKRNRIKLLSWNKCGRCHDRY